MCLHLIALSAILVLPKIISKSEKESTKNYKKYSNKSDNSNNTKQYNDEKALNFINSNVPRQEQNSMNEQILDFINDINYKYESNTDANKSIPYTLSNNCNTITNDTSILNNKIEDLFDKTVTGIVELKEDLMRMNENNEIFINSDGFRKRNINPKSECHPTLLIKNNDSNADNIKDYNTFLIKDKAALNNSVQQTNVLPAVLSNGNTKYY